MNGCGKPGSFGVPICCTNNFASKISGKQLGSYAGVVPFEHTSGISVTPFSIES
jgi:hypothetical protein